MRDKMQVAKRSGSACSDGDNYVVLASVEGGEEFIYSNSPPNYAFHSRSDRFAIESFGIARHELHSSRKT
jgi:hypothetical protein